MSLEEKIEQLMELQIGNLIDKAIEYEETHVDKVIFHLSPDFVINGVSLDNYDGKLGFDDYGISAYTGEPMGNLIERNDDGDYVLYDVEIGNHSVGLTYNNNRSISGLSCHDIYGDWNRPSSEHSTEVYIDNNHKEFIITDIGEPQVTTQQEI